MWFRWNTPDWLYEALPYLYVVSGFVVILVLGNGMAVFSGLLLISAGAVVAFKRMANRMRKRMATRPATEGSTPGAHFAYGKLVWRNEYSCGNPAVDAQHRGLFAAGNVVLDAMRTNQSKSEVERLLYKLVEDFDDHFRTEESILGAISPFVAEAHRQIHRELRGRASTLLRCYNDGKVEIGEVISFLTDDLIASHIAKEVMNVRFVCKSQRKS